jgi:MOSC domain-containing protein YiiM
VRAVPWAPGSMESEAVYAYAVDDLAFWAAELDRSVGPGNVGENLTLSGVDCSGAVVGERWQVGEAVLRVTGPRRDDGRPARRDRRPPGPGAQDRERT